MDARGLLSPDSPCSVFGFDEVRATSIAVELRARLVHWAQVHGRSYPWRDTRDADRVLIAEVLLHRTRADQVAPLYLALVERYPTILALAAAPPNDVRALLWPLGLRWRVDLLIEMAQTLVRENGGRVPDDSHALQALPGVGPYISAAVLCFGHGHAVPILDTNTVRILSRVFSIPLTDGSRRSRQYQRIMTLLVDPHHPREFNFGLLDLGALVCTPKHPACIACPVQPICEYGRTARHDHRIR